MSAGAITLGVRVVGRIRTALAVIVALEAAVALTGAGYLLLGLITEEATERAGAVWETVLAALLGAGLGLLCRPARQGRSWARGPVLTWQLVQFPVAWYMAGSELWFVGLALLAASLLGVAIAVRRETFGPQSPA